MALCVAADVQHGGSGSAAQQVAASTAQTSSSNSSSQHLITTFMQPYSISNAAQQAARQRPDNDLDRLCQVSRLADSCSSVCMAAIQAAWISNQGSKLQREGYQEL